MTRERIIEIICNTISADAEFDFEVLADAILAEMPAETSIKQEREDIIACIRSATWGGTEEIVAMIRRRSPSQPGAQERPEAQVAGE